MWHTVAANDKLTAWCTRTPGVVAPARKASTTLGCPEVPTLKTRPHVGRRPWSCIHTPRDFNSRNHRPKVDPNEYPEGRRGGAAGPHLTYGGKP